MNLLLIIIVCSTLAAMFLCALCIDRRRSERELRKEERSLVNACRKWIARGPEGPREG
jgi:hypothetical protein